MNINSQSQGFYNVAGLEDLSYENAAACSGGRLTLYNNRIGEPGAAVSFSAGAVPNLGSYGFNDLASSVEVTNGQKWRLWINPNYGGPSITYGEGAYNLFGIFNNGVSSVSRIA